MYRGNGETQYFVRLTQKESPDTGYPCQIVPRTVFQVSAEVLRRRSDGRGSYQSGRPITSQDNEVFPKCLDTDTLVLWEWGRRAPVRRVSS